MARRASAASLADFPPVIPQGENWEHHWNRFKSCYAAAINYRTDDPRLWVQPQTTPQLREVLEKVCRWCLGWRGEHDLDPEKNLLIMGPPGTGKTSLLRAIKKFMPSVRAADEEGRPYSFKIVPCADVVDDYETGGKSRLDGYILNRRQAYDDLGAESLTGSHFASKIVPMRHVLEGRYRRMYDKAYLTHVTTNLTLPEIVELYGDRLGDRLNEMFNFIEMPGQSFRRQPALVAADAVPIEPPPAQPPSVTSQEKARQYSIAYGVPFADMSEVIEYEQQMVAERGQMTTTPNGLYYVELLKTQ